MIQTLAKCLLLVLIVATSAVPQSNLVPPSADEAPDCLGGTIQDIKNAFSQSDKSAARSATRRILQRWPVYVCQFTADPIRAKLLAEAEQKRLDKQPGTGGSSAGSTSVSNKGSAPWLLGFALEHGGLTQSSDGNTVTFRGNLTNSIRALMNSTYLGSYRLGEDDSLVQGLSKLSFGVSFDATETPATSVIGFVPTRSNFSGLSAKYEIINRRDPRDKRYRQDWNRLAGEQGQALAATITNLDGIITGTYQTEFVNWSDPLFKAVTALPVDPSDEDIRKLVREAAESFHQRFWDLPKVKDSVAQVTSRMSTFLEAQDRTIERIRGTPMLTLQFDLTRQSVGGEQVVAATVPGQKLPKLSTLNLIYEQGIKGGNTPELTFNFATTWFSSPDPMPSGRGRLRDIRASVQLDLPLREIQNIGRPVFSLSGQFLNLMEEPLGQTVAVDGVTIDRRGKIGLVQAKVSIPVKDSGMKIPISLTYASRTELIKEKDVRGNIGITFDLDALFSKPR